MPKTIYEATLPCGTVVTRGTERTYTHAMCTRVTYNDKANGLIDRGDEGRWLVNGFCGSEELAHKSARATAGRWSKVEYIAKVETMIIPAVARTK